MAALPKAKQVANNTVSKINSLGPGLVSSAEAKRYQNWIDRQQGVGQQQINLAQGADAQNAIAGAQTGANYAAGTAGAGYDFSQQLLPYATQIMNMGLDPQQELYDRTLHQTQEAQRVGQAARGIEMSPYGAGLENEAVKNFNIDWQNNALDRAVTGANAGAALGSNAFQLGNDASKLAASGALLPYSTKLGFLNDQSAGYDTKLGAMEREANFGTVKNQTTQQQIADFLQYLGMGPGYQSAQTGENTANFDMATKGLGMLTGLFGK